MTTPGLIDNQYQFYSTIAPTNPQFPINGFLPQQSASNLMHFNTVPSSANLSPFSLTNNFGHGINNGTNSPISFNYFNAHQLQESAIDSNILKTQNFPNIDNSTLSSFNSALSNNKSSSVNSSCHQSINSSNNVSTNNLEPIISLKILLNGKEIGSIIGKKGDNIKKIRDESGARINISDSGSNPERIVTITGNCDQVATASDLICKKIEFDFFNQIDSPSDKMIDSKAIALTNSTKPSPMNIRIMLPPAHYSCVIGDCMGSRLKQLKQATNTQVTIENDVYTNSAEKIFTITGLRQNISQLLHEVTIILLEVQDSSQLTIYPNKPQFNEIGTTNGHLTPQIYSDTMAFNPATFPIIPLPNLFPQSYFNDNLAYQSSLPAVNQSNLNIQLPSLLPWKFPNFIGPPTCYTIPPAYSPHPILSTNKTPLLSTSSMSNHQPHHHSSPASAVSANNNNGPIISREFFLYNDIIGCIIGRGGSTINEIRSVSGAQIKIANCEEGKQERRISISGTVEAVHMAQLLINSSIETFKQSIQMKNKSPQQQHLQQQHLQLQQQQQQQQQVAAQSIILSHLIPHSTQPHLSLTQNILNFPTTPLLTTTSTPVTIDTDTRDKTFVTNDFKSECSQIQSNNNICFQQGTILKMKSSATYLDGSNKSSANQKFRPY